MKKAPLDDDHQNLERQVERGSFYMHTVLADYAKRINELESFLYGLIDIAVEKDIVSQPELQAAIEKIRSEIEAHREMLHPGIAVRVDQEDAPAPKINCAERLHICKAICCKLNFALSIEEIESGKTKWDLGKPYYNRKECSGYCTHLDTEKTCCNVYDDRPKVCRQYSCEHDKRIWKDFDNMVLNTEWIETYLQDARIRARETMMIEMIPGKPDEQ